MFRKFRAKRFIKLMNKLAGQLSVTIESVETKGDTLYLEIFHMYKSPVMYVIDFKTKEIETYHTQMNKDWNFTGGEMIQKTKSNLSLYFFNNREDK